MMCVPVWLHRCLQKLLMVAKQVLADTLSLSPTPPITTAAMTHIQSASRAIVRLCLKSVPSHVRGVIDRVRLSLALDTTPVHKYVPKSVIEDVIGQLLSHLSPAQYVNEVLLAVQSGSHAASSNQSQARADAVKSLLGLAVVSLE